MIHSPGHPGQLVAEELEAREISISRAARDLGISRQSLHRIIDGKQPVTTDVATKIGHYFRGGADVLVSMQAQHDLWKSQQKLKNTLTMMPIAPAAG